MLKHIIFFVISMLAALSGYGQDNFSESFLYSPKNIHVFIPALVSREDKFQANAVYKSYQGKLSVLRTQFADLNFTLNPNSENENKSHTFGLGVYSDKEGEFFNKNRVLFRYALHLPLNEKYTLSGGAAFHLINYNFHASGSSAAGSATVGSGSISAALTSSSFKFGLSFNDLNNPKIQPIFYPFTIYRYSCLYTEKEILVVENTYIKGGGRYNIIFNQSSSFLFHIGFLFSRSIGVSYLYYVNKGNGFSLEINKIKLAPENNLDFAFAYMVPVKNQGLPGSQYELNLKYYLRK